MLKNVLYTLIIKLKVQVQIQFGYNSQYYIVTNIEVQIFLIFYTLKASFTAGTCQLDSANGAIHPTTGMHCLWLFILIKTFFLQFFGYTLKILASAGISKPEVRTKNIESLKIKRFNKFLFLQESILTLPLLVIHMYQYCTLGALVNRLSAVLLKSWILICQTLRSLAVAQM